MTLTSHEIRAAVESFYLNSLETELLGCIALALADISDCLSDIRQALTPSISRGDVSRNDGDRKTISSIGASHQCLCEGQRGR